MDSEKRVIEAIATLANIVQSSMQVTKVKNYVYESDEEDDLFSTEQVSAATRIQKMVRGYNDRKPKLAIQYKSDINPDILTFECKFGFRDLVQDVAAKFRDFLGKDKVHFTFTRAGKKVDMYRTMWTYYKDYVIPGRPTVFVAKWKCSFQGGGYSFALI